MQTKIARGLEILALVLIAAGWLLFLVTHVGKVASLMWVAVAPLGAWLYARARMPRHACAVVWAICGLVAFPFSHGLFALLLLPLPMSILGVLGLLGEGLHGLPGNLVATYLHIEWKSDRDLDVILIHYMLNGIVWAAVYGYVGFTFDRARHGKKGERGARLR